MPRSIKARMLTSSLVILCGFLGLAAIALDAANRHRSRTALESQLQASVYTLLAAAEEDEQGRMRLPEVMAAPDFNRPDSGLYARVAGENDRYQWHSASLLGRALYPLERRAVGETRLREQLGLYIFEQGVGWEDLSGNSLEYTLSVATDAAPWQAEQRAFRNSLWVWLGGGALAMILAQFFLVRWGMAPLQGMAAAVQKIERGEADRIAGELPEELAGLADNLNSLIRQNARRQARVRNSLADLAHSLKTPLAVLRGATTQAQPELTGLIDEQVLRIDEIVSYQRQRAAVAGDSAVNRAILLRPIVERLCNSLCKVHHQRQVDCRNGLAAGFSLRADEGDLFELLGNLLENAFKHCRSVVAISARRLPGGCVILVEDDGPGIPEDQVERLLQRGERADERFPGQGIGLAVANEIVHQYDGRLEVSRSTLGGACVSAILR